MSEQIKYDDFITALQGQKVPGMDPKWRLILRMARNVLITQKNERDALISERKKVFKIRMQKTLENNALISKKKKSFDYKSWFLILVIGSSGAFATKEFVHFTKPLPLELTFTQEELDGQDPKLFWKKWFNNGTFVMFGQRTISKPVPTNLTDCHDLKDCQGLLKNNPHNPNLLFNIALKYESGKDKDIEKALEFYKRSMALGNFYAQYNYDNLITKKKK
jgi:hypothetical protein